MRVPPKGTLARQEAELRVRVWQLELAIWRPLEASVIRIIKGMRHPFFRYWFPGFMVGLSLGVWMWILSEGYVGLSP